MPINYDQHFLFNEEILDLEIQEMQISNKDTILEIGPGKLPLTKKILLKSPQKLIAVDIDKTFEDELKKLSENNINFEYKISNALDEIEETYFTKLVGNIPYSITEPLYEKILKKEISFALLLHGEDFYKIIKSKESKWSYFIPAFYKVELIKEISGDEFEPKTKVKSVLLKLSKKKSLKMSDKILQTLFKKQDRTVKNALIFTFVDIFKISKNDAKLKLDKFEIAKKTQEKKLKNISNKEFLKIIENILS